MSTTIFYGGDESHPNKRITAKGFEALERLNLPLTTDHTAISSPAEGLIVENTTTNKTWKYSGGAWSEVGSGGIRLTAEKAGIVGDGESNITTALQSALNTSGINEIVFNDGDYTISGTVTVPTGKRLVFYNKAKLIGTGTLNGGIIEADKKEQVFATTLTVTNLENAEVSVVWFGAKAEYEYNVGNGTDNLVPFQKAIASAKVAGTVIVPKIPQSVTKGKWYHFSGPLTIGRQITLIGEGKHNTVLIFPGNGYGIKVATDEVNIKDLQIRGNSGNASDGFNSSTASGILVAGNATRVTNVMVLCFDGNGFSVQADVSSATNGNNSSFKYCDSIGNGRAGYYFAGGDANNCAIEECNAVANARWNFWDGSFLGNHFSACHSASAVIDHPYNKSAVKKGSNYYVAISDNINIEPPNAAYWKDFGTDFTAPFHSTWTSSEQYYSGGQYYVSDPNAQSVFSGCYAEGDSPSYKGNGRSLVLGGFLSNYGMEAGSLGTLFGYLTAKLMQFRDAETGNAIIIDSELKTITFQPLTGQSYGLRFGNGGFTSIWGNLNNSATILFATPSKTNAADFISRDDFGQGVKLVLNEGVWLTSYSNEINRMLGASTSAPTSGNFATGDILLNVNHSKPYINSWICTTASVSNNGGTWRIRFNTISGTTAGRPTPTSTENGAPYYDETLGIPIWWNGSVWKDATGTTV
jgi:hypothetical protein